MINRLGSSCLMMLTVLATSGLGGARAQAQAPHGAPAAAPAQAATPLPLAVDLRKVPVGSWSEYRIADGQNTMAVRMALVARLGQKAQVETEVKGGPMAALGRTTMRMSLAMDATGEVKPTDQVVQLGENPPMTLPAEMAGARAQTFKKLDPKQRIGVDSITVAAGAFPKAEHYQEKGASGETIDFWVTKTVLPFGLIKVTSSGAPGGKALAMELTGHGAGAKPIITKTPQAFDPALIMKQAQPAMSGGHGSPPAGGPPPRPIPSPHPGMPGTTPAATPAPPAKDGKK